MQNKKLIIALLAVFVVTNGSFFVLCEKDVVLDCINKFGDWTNALLWHSSKAFLFYAVADTFYNIRYLVPKVAYALAPLKWADKLNGYLGFSSKGELEQYLTYHKYQPLYKDALDVCKTNIVSPLLGYLQIKPLTVEKQVPIFVDRVKVEYCDRVHVRTVYRTRDNENILSVRQSLNELRSAVEQYTISKSGLQLNFADLHAEMGRLELLGRLQKLDVSELQNICRLDNGWLPHNHEIIRIEQWDEFWLSKGEMSPTSLGECVPGIRVYYKSKSIWGNTDSERSLLINGYWFLKTYPNICKLFDGYSSNAVTTELHIVYRNKEIDTSKCTFVHKDTNQRIKIVDYIRENTLLTIDQLQTNFDALIDRVDQRLDEISRPRSNQGSQTDNLSDHSVLLEQVEEYLDSDTRKSLSQDPADSIFGTSSTNVSAAAAMGTLGIIGTISQLPLNDIFTIFTHFLGLSHFEPLLANPEAVKCLINIYANATGSVPAVLLDAVTLPNPQDYLLPGESLLEPATPSSLTPNTPTPYFNWTTVGVTVLAGCAIAGGVYLWKNGYLDSNTVVEGTKTLKDTLYNKYVNFK